MKRLFVLLTLVASTRVGAQSAKPGPYAEYRADVITGNSTGVEIGGGPSLLMGTYVRLALIGAAGTTRVDDAAKFSGRVEGIARFTLDPLREVPFALSLGGGASVPYVQDQTRTRPYLVGVIDVEGRRRGRFSPALQIGLGGGTRIGIVLRASPPNYR